MASGSRPSGRTDSTPRPVLGPSGGTIVLAVFALLSAAAAVILTLLIRGPAFAASLAEIDAALAGGDVKAAHAAFQSACRNADGADEWLSILKRARTAEALGDTGLYLKTAMLALRREPSSEPIAAAAAHAYLRNGKPDEAYALFLDRNIKADERRTAARISPADRPALWAEAFLRSSAAQRATMRDYAALASIVDDGAPYLGAVVLSLAEGDVAAGRYWMQRALETGLSPPISLMWDCGFYEELASRNAVYADAQELAILGDAAWKVGDVELAREYWKRSLADEPLRSWKCYAALALSSEDRETAESYWERMRAAFLSGPRSQLRDGALRAYASHLSRKGLDAEAIRIISDAGSSPSASLRILETAIRAKTEPEGRVLSEFASLDQTMPNEGEVIGARLRLLAERGRTEEFIQAFESAEKRGVEPKYRWFYEAWSLAARGMLSQAADLLSREGGDEAGPAAAFALGAIRSAQSRFSEAAGLFQKAASSAADKKARAAALKAKGRALQAAGDQAAAAAAYKAAALEDESDAEAAVLARGLGAAP